VQAIRMRSSPFADVKIMKKKIDELNDELRPAYHFSNMQIVRRGSGRKSVEEITVTLAPDVAKNFPTSEAVNNALRRIINKSDKLQTLG
jgi:hypothetical protein